MVRSKSEKAAAIFHNHVSCPFGHFAQCLEVVGFPLASLADEQDETRFGGASNWPLNDSHGLPKKEKVSSKYAALDPKVARNRNR